MEATRHSPRDRRFRDFADHSPAESFKPKAVLRPLGCGGDYRQHARVAVSERHALNSGGLDLSEKSSMLAGRAVVSRPSVNGHEPHAPQNSHNHIHMSQKISPTQGEPMARDHSIPLGEDHDQGQQLPSTPSHDDGSSAAVSLPKWSVFGQSRLFWNQSLTLLLFISAVCLGISMVVALLVPSLAVLRSPLFMLLVLCALWLPWTWYGLSAISIGAAVAWAAFTLSMVGVLPVAAALPGLAGTAVVIIVLGGGGPKTAASPAPVGTTIRLPGPAQRQGRLLSVAKLLFSQWASMLNPWQLAQMTRQFRGLVATWVTYRGAFPDVNTYEQQTQYYLPVQGRWLVAHGSVQLDSTPPRGLWNQRYAYDLLVINDQGGSHRGEGSDRTDYFCYGEPVVAPAPGEVVEVRSDVPERVRPGTLTLDWLAKDMRGNYCVIRHCEGEYSFLSHFIPGTLRVQVGQMVQTGDVLGHCGQSGHASEPLLHFRVQDHQDFFQAVSLPVVFTAIAVDDDIKQTAYLQMGQMVESTWVRPEGRSRSVQTR